MKKQESREAHAGASGYGDRVNPDSAKNMRVSRGEETVLGLMLLYDEHRAAICSGAVPLTEEDFFTDFGRRAFCAILELERSDAGFEIGLLGEHFTPEELGRLENLQWGRCKRCGFDPWVGKIPWSRKWQHTPVFLPRNFHGQRSLVGYSP